MKSNYYFATTPKLAVPVADEPGNATKEDFIPIE